MPLTQAGSAVVVVAHHFNPSILTQLWLVRQGIVLEGDFLDGCVFSDVVVHVKAKQFNLLVFREQLQFVPLVEPEHQQALIVERIGKLVRVLPHIPYSALGLNFNWHLTPVESDVAQLTRDLFPSLERPLYQRFDTPDARFGAYLSKDFAGFRMKLDIKPVSIAESGIEEGAGEDLIRLAFNFHCDIGDEGPALIEEQLARWNEVRQEAEQIVATVKPGP